MADVASSTAVSALVSALWSDVRGLADERDVDLDLRLLGKPAELSDQSRVVVIGLVGGVVDSARSAAELHHVALEVAFGAAIVSIRIEHDGTLGSGQRLKAESLVLAKYGEVGEAGGTLALSSGRGYGMRIELTMPYKPVDGPGISIPPPPGGIPLQRTQATAGDSLEVVEPLTAQEATTLNLLAVGLSNKEIAGRMHLGVGTVKFHLAQIYQKLGVQGRGRVAAVARARDLGLIFD
jgi:DNA-binding CsgD family transcriptional regulator